MTEVHFSEKTELTGTRKEIAKKIVEIIKKEGSKRTAELRDSLYSDFEEEYDTKSSFHRTIGYIREIMVNEGFVDTIRVDSEGSRKTWKWRVE